MNNSLPRFRSGPPDSKDIFPAFSGSRPPLDWRGGSGLEEFFSSAFAISLHFPSQSGANLKAISPAVTQSVGRVIIIIMFKNNPRIESSLVKGRSTSHGTDRVVSCRVESGRVGSGGLKVSPVGKGHPFISFYIRVGGTRRYYSFGRIAPKVWGLCVQYRIWSEGFFYSIGFIQGLSLACCYQDIWHNFSTALPIWGQNTWNLTVIFWGGVENRVKSGEPLSCIPQNMLRTHGWHTNPNCVIALSTKSAVTNSSNVFSSLLSLSLALISSLVRESIVR